MSLRALFNRGGGGPMQRLANAYRASCGVHKYGKCLSFEFLRNFRRRKPP